MTAIKDLKDQEAEDAITRWAKECATDRSDKLHEAERKLREKRIQNHYRGDNS